MGDIRTNDADEVGERVRGILRELAESLAFSAPENQHLFWERANDAVENLVSDLKGSDDE